MQDLKKKILQQEKNQHTCSKRSSWLSLSQTKPSLLNLIFMDAHSSSTVSLGSGSDSIVAADCSARLFHPLRLTLGWLVFGWLDQYWSLILCASLITHQERLGRPSCKLRWRTSGSGEGICFTTAVGPRNFQRLKAKYFPFGYFWGAYFLWLIQRHCFYLKVFCDIFH
jgi:hypothetical protein